MLETAYAQLRFGASILFGRPFHLPSLNCLVDSLLATQHEFGVLTGEANELIAGPSLDDETRRDFQFRRFRAQARRAARATSYYAALFAQLGIDPRRLGKDDVGRLPLTTKQTVQEQLPGFVRSTQNPTLRTMTTGTTGKASSMFFTPREMEIFIALSAFSLLFQGHITADDIVQISTSARGLLANSTFQGACQRVGALVYQTGIVEPAQSLAFLAEQHALPGKKERASVLMTYPSYLGRLFETGARLGHSADDFGLEHIILGGEIVTEGLKRRAQTLFGKAKFSEGYGITETWPFGGTQCEAGHLHFEPSHGLMEVIDPDTGQPALPGDVGTLVLTPFAPYRESVVLLRYDTQDMVRVLDEPCTCSLRHMPATSRLLGKRRLSARYAGGWTYPRQVLEAVEAIDEVPLPARCGFWAEADGVAVEVAVLQPAPSMRSKIGDALEANGVPVCALHLHSDPAQLSHALPWRGDLHEASFTTSAMQRKGQQT